MIRKVEEYCLQQRLFQPGETLIVACSGGPDSLALLDVLSQLAPVHHLDLVAVYVHHGIRQAADAEVDFVRRESLSRHCRFEWTRVDVPALAAQRHESEETTGRTERYRILREFADEYGAAAIAVAHHQDDQAETVLHHILRGSGISGLVGMRPRADGIIRPFLCVSRQEILAYNEAQGFTPCMDETNESTAYTRNRIRLQLLPELAQFNPSIRADLNRLADIARADEDYLEGAAQRLFHDLADCEGQTWRIGKDALQQQPLAMQRRLVRHLCQLAGQRQLPVPYHYVEQILALSHKPTGRRFMADHLCIYTTYDKLCFIPANSGDDYPVTEPGQDERSVPVNGAGTYVLGPYTATVTVTSDGPSCEERPGACTAVFDYTACPQGLELRFRHSGDAICLGQKSQCKTLKKYFIDKKVPLSVRHTIPLLCSGNDVLWICGYAQNSKVSVTAGTKVYMICTITGGKFHA